MSEVAFFGDSYTAGWSDPTGLGRVGRVVGPPPVPDAGLARRLAALSSAMAGSPRPRTRRSWI
jgi:hypothetical protein